MSRRKPPKKQARRFKARKSETQKELNLPYAKTKAKLNLSAFSENHHPTKPTAKLLGSFRTRQTANPTAKPLRSFSNRKNHERAKQNHPGSLRSKSTFRKIIGVLKGLMLPLPPPASHSTRHPARGYRRCDGRQDGLAGQKPEKEK